jgi:hypothetical protein
MNRTFKLLVLSFTVLFLFSGGAMANPITIYDGNSLTETGWTGKDEDNEVEPGMVQSQVWDLEQFLLVGTTLEIVGGYDFKDGLSGHNSGDIFIGGSDVLYGDAAATASIGTNANDKMKNIFNYDYAIDLIFDPSGQYKYNVYKIDASTDVETAVYYDYPLAGGISNQASNPIELTDPNLLAVTYSGDLNFIDEADASDGKYHLSIDIGFLLEEGWAGEEFISHYTMQCGNDNIMGQGTVPVPEPATMLLLGVGLIGIAGISRKKLVKK